MSAAAAGAKFFPMQCEKCGHVWPVPFGAHLLAQSCPSCAFRFGAVIWRPQAGPQFAFVRAGEFEVLGGGARGGG